MKIFAVVSTACTSTKGHDSGRAVPLRDQWRPSHVQCGRNREAPCADRATSVG